MAPDARTIKLHNTKGKTLKTIKIKNANSMPVAEEIISAQQAGKNRILLHIMGKKAKTNTAVMVGKNSGKFYGRRKISATAV